MASVQKKPAPSLLAVELALCDTGPLVALFSPKDFAHELCREAVERFRGNLVTTPLVLKEVLHFLKQPRHRKSLWHFVKNRKLLQEFVFGGHVKIVEHTPADHKRMRELMQTYATLPMDLADASLVVVGERLKLSRVFTLDRRHFQKYRPYHTEAFEIFP